MSQDFPPLNRLVQVTLRHTGLSSMTSCITLTYALSEALVIALCCKTKTILNDDGDGEVLGCNPDGK